MNHTNTQSHCSCSHHKTLPAFLVLIGLSFLLANLGIISAEVNSFVWPILIILLGVMKLKGGSCKCYMQQA